MSDSLTIVFKGATGSLYEIPVPPVPPIQMKDLIPLVREKILKGKCDGTLIIVDTDTGTRVSANDETPILTNKEIFYQVLPPNPECHSDIA